MDKISNSKWTSPSCPATHAMLISKGCDFHLYYRLKIATLPHALGIFTIKDLSIPVAARGHNPPGERIHRDIHYLLSLTHAVALFRNIGLTRKPQAAAGERFKITTQAKWKTARPTEPTGPHMKNSYTQIFPRSCFKEKDA